MLYENEIYAFDKLFLLLLIAHSSDSYFTKIGPCLFPRQVTCPDEHINFYLYTRANRHDAEKVDPNTDAILESRFHMGSINKFIIHGYGRDLNTPELQEIKEAYLNRGDFNVWMVDWKVVAKGPCYPVVLASLNHVGACVAQFIENVRSCSTYTFQDQIHVIGFSLGAHVSAYIANHLKPYKLPRITDVIHTDVTVKGKWRRCGHVDFYMNGGFKQPGCARWNLKKYVSCNHRRAASYFAESITSEIGFWGYPCKSVFHYLFNKCPPTTPSVLMGEYCDGTATGHYIIPTAAQKPFALGRSFIHDE